MKMDTKHTSQSQNYHGKKVSRWLLLAWWILAIVITVKNRLYMDTGPNYIAWNVGKTEELKNDSD
jgi:hypothetical protein